MRRRRVGEWSGLEGHALLHGRHRRRIRVIFQSVKFEFVANRQSGRNGTFWPGRDLTMVAGPNGLLKYQ